MGLQFKGVRGHFKGVPPHFKGVRRHFKGVPPPLKVYLLTLKAKYFDLSYLPRHNCDLCFDFAHFIVKLYNT